MLGLAPKGVPTVLVTVGTPTSTSIDHLGRRLGAVSVPTTGAGYAKLLSWA